MIGVILGLALIVYGAAMGGPDNGVEGALVDAEVILGIVLILIGLLTGV